MEKGKSTTRSIERAFDILECFLEGRKALSLMELAKQVDLPASTVHRLIASLERRHYLSKDENKKYRLGSMISRLGRQTMDQMGEDFTQVALPYMYELRRQFNESVSLYVVEGDHRVCVERVESTHSLRRVIKIGESLPLEVGAGGRLLLSYMPEEERRAKGLDSLITPEMAEHARSMGYTVSDGERANGLAAVAVPIFNFTGRNIAGLSISGPSVRMTTDMDRLQEMVVSLKEYGEKISLKLGYDGEPAK